MTEGSIVTRKLGHKVRLGDDAAEVAHTSLYLDDAEWDVLVALPADVLTKTRTLVPYDGTTVAVDVHADGTVVAEIDGGDGPARELPPSYDVVREVTDEEEFTGARWPAPVDQPDRARPSCPRCGSVLAASGAAAVAVVVLGVGHVVPVVPEVEPAQQRDARWSVVSFMGSISWVSSRRSCHAVENTPDA